MKRISLLKRVALAAFFTIFNPSWLKAQDAPKQPEPPAPTLLVVSPAAEPSPALKYRFLPNSAELIPGDAAPIYLRAHGYEDTSLDQAWRQISEKAGKWLQSPLKELAVGDARTFVNLWTTKLEQIEFGTRRKTCDWNYTLPEQRLASIEILLPDAQSMRQWGRILAIKVRVEIAEKKYDQAVNTIETGIAFGCHASQGPFLINGLIGIALVNMMLDRVEELIAEPGSPNLYWALTALPEPLVDLRGQYELEQRLVENLFPEMRDEELNQARTPLEWSVLLSRTHERIVKWCHGFTPKEAPGVQPLLEWDLRRFTAEALAEARKSIKNSQPPKAGAESDDQIVMQYLVREFRSLRDDFFKPVYLPARQALTQFGKSEERLKAANKPGPLALFAAIQPQLRSVIAHQLRQERRIAVLRVIEAIRLYAASHNGALPDSLARITEVAIPNDSATAKPFEYLLNGNTADLSGPVAGLPVPGPFYRLTIRP